MVFYLVCLFFCILMMYLYSTLYEYASCKPEDKIKFPIILWIFVGAISLIPYFNLILAVIGYFMLFNLIIKEEAYSNSWLFKLK